MNAEYRQRFAAIDWTPLPEPVRVEAIAPARADLPCPRVITDGMPLTEHIDGKHYDSKSAYRAVTKANGYVEVGNDPSRFRKPGQNKADPKARRAAADKAIQQVLGH